MKKTSMFARGAEAIIVRGKALGKPALIKERTEKRYRVKTLDKKLRTERTRREAKLLQKASFAGVSCPVVLETTEHTITITRLNGRKYSTLSEKHALFAGIALAKLHNANIIHGDYTLANLLFEEGKMHVIDFGLGFFSTEIEHKAIDVLTMLKSLNSDAHNAFLRGYRHNKDYARVLQRLEQVKARVRYA